MKNNFLHIEAFEKERSNPKVLLKFLLLFLLSCITAFISISLTDYTSILKDLDLASTDIDSALTLFKILGIIMSIIIYIFIFLMYFVITLIIAKVANLNVEVKSILAATLLMLIIISFIQIVILSIQWIFGLQLPDINIGSLNVLSPGQPILGSINIQNILTAWLFGVVLYSTCHLSKKWAWIFAMIHLIFTILIGVIGFLVA
ncbi:hypothetical protein NQ016_06760 [Staphylococcus hyicus]|uniref:hypothetical protein n=1 Tax=Staphylococcus hyicus TaxID=1284 RepID=UPI00211CC162|nr:hypothetical protein [Staphylococcus hyicus]MCQ9291190.1 hypothetical protein [Staphylococcus hyicus]MCQ9306431.1 hypothetical protein [Staphylococcus hyicus]MCQ9308844.1 hypothetical protein [Staphylococcus hyicus]MCQ9311265.1 hypothetical protein [Staphylococcus hyicus]